jgi:hypothetical protein
LQPLSVEKSGLISERFDMSGFLSITPDPDIFLSNIPFRDTSFHTFLLHDARGPRKAYVPTAASHVMSHSVTFTKCINSSIQNLLSGIQLSGEYTFLNSILPSSSFQKACKHANFGRSQFRMFANNPGKPACVSSAITSVNTPALLPGGLCHKVRKGKICRGDVMRSA